MSMILLDGSRFYAAASVIMTPQLQDLPIVICSGPDGIIIANNRISSNLHLKKFKPVWEQIDTLRAHNGVAIEANFSTLGNLSRRMFQSIISAMGSDIPYWIYSVDEIFFDASRYVDIGVDIDEHLSKVRHKVYKETRCGTGASFGRTMTLCKIASFSAKNLSPYKGQCVLLNEKDEDIALKQIPVRSVWNIGSKLTEHLRHRGIETAYQLKKASVSEMKKCFGINVSNIVLELNGTSIYNFDSIPTVKKQIFSTASYRERLSSSELIAQMLSKHASEVARKSRVQQTEIKTLYAFVSTSSFDKCQPYKQSVEVCLDYATDDTRVILQLIREALPKLIPADPHRQPIYKVGVGATSLISSKQKQFELFQPAVSDRGLMSTLDTLNNRFGKGCLTFAAEKQQKREKFTGNVPMLRLSDYLTRYSDLPVIKCD